MIPPLRERREEIEALAREFIAQLRASSRAQPTPAARRRARSSCCCSYSWPGNIRELRNVIERAVLLAGNGPILLEHLPVEKMTATVSTPLSRTPVPGGPGSIEVIHVTGKETLVPPNGDTSERALARRAPAPAGQGSRAPAHHRRADALRRQPDARRQGARHLAAHADQPARGVQHPASAQGPPGGMSRAASARSPHGALHERGRSVSQHIPPPPGAPRVRARTSRSAIPASACRR